MESNKFINLLNISEINNIELGHSEFTGNKGLGIKCRFDYTSPSPINNTNNNIINYKNNGVENCKTYNEYIINVSNIIKDIMQ